MNILKISWKNLLEKPLSTLLSLLLLTLGVGIISLLLLLNQQLEAQFNKNIKGIDMVVGAKGSPLQLILASVYHIDFPTGNIPKEEADRLVKNPLIEWSIPLAYGDNFQSYRIVGTNHSYATHYEAELQAGKLWDAPFEATIGATVARELGMKIGDTFYSSHGLTSSEDVHRDKTYTVVGIFDPTNTVIDQLILCSVESVWAIHEKEEAPAPDSASTPMPTAPNAPMASNPGQMPNTNFENSTDDTSEDSKELTALLIGFRNPMGMISIPRMVNQQTSMQAALPAIEVNRLWDLLGVGINTMRGVALAIIIISGISVFISLFNSLKERKYELALMRSLGASRAKLFQLIILEGFILSFLGYILGIIVSRVGLLLLSQSVASDYHYDISSINILSEESVLLIATVVIGLLAAAIPAIKAFNLNISQTLAEG